VLGTGGADKRATGDFPCETFATGRGSMLYVGAAKTAALALAERCNDAYAISKSIPGENVATFARTTSSVSVPLTVFDVEDTMMRLLTGVVVVLTAGFVLVGQSVGQDEKKPDFRGMIKEVKKAEEGAKGLGTLTILAGKKDDQTEKTVKVGKKTDIAKFAGKGNPPDKGAFDDLKEGQFVSVWLREGSTDIAQKIVVGGGKKKKKADN
jgi:hypothetical protein